MIPLDQPDPDTDPRAPRSEALGWRIWSALLLVWLAAAGARLASVGVLLPHDAELHERVFVRQLELYEGAPRAAGADPNAAYYPTLVPWLASLAGRESSAPATQDAAEVTARRVLRLRRLCSLLSSLVVFGTFWLGLRLAGPRAGLFGALFVATSLMATTLGWQARPHGVGMALAALALASIVEASRRRSTGSSLLAGAIVGLALANLQSSVLLLPALVVGHLSWWRVNRGRALAFAVLALAAALAVALPFQPDVGLVDESVPRGFANGARYVELVGHAVLLDAWHGAGFARLAAGAWSFDPLLWLSAAAGLLFLAARTWVARAGAHRTLPAGASAVLPAGASAVLPAGASAVLAFTLPYVLAVGLYDRSEQRFLSPLVPIAAVVAGCAAARWVEPARDLGRAALGLRLALALLPIASSAVVVTGHVRAQAAPDTEREVAAFLASRPGRIAQFPGARFPTGPPASGALDPARLVRAPLVEVDEIDRARRDPGAFVEELDTEWAVVAVWNPVHLQGREGVLDQIRARLRQRARSVDRFVPWSDGETLVPYLYDYPHCGPAGPWWLCALRAQRSGPALELYDLRTEASIGPPPRAGDEEHR